MKKSLEFKNPFHPGKVLLEEFLIPQELTQAQFADDVGWTKAKLNEIIKGKRGITADTALDLADALGTTPEIWMNMQSAFDLSVARKTRKKRA
ncbi:hypothetical protein AZI86_12600 [Bdellovibrio bacteriovorus]|uniref:HTH cro/C1-type domain-containing protein n=1 Tax=Bdellovibrio bacteriovorus TaxID=959 RepID=A0A150WJ60_BDEBC|nr:HigA family addiction module antitoxin [Bdellovibrio bacteriovorus]KYG63663.1 hypothetical protein AZI86_12600 [Bdellovibrio bacteriovorus]